MRVVDDRVLDFDTANNREGQAAGHAVAFLSRVLETEVHGRDTRLLGKLVDHALDGEGCLGGAWGAVGADLGLVHDHVEAIDEDVLDVVGGEGGGGAGADGRARERTRLVRHPHLGGGDLAVVRGAHLRADVAAEVGPEASKTSVRLIVTFTGWPLCLERSAATGSTCTYVFAPKPPPISIGITVTWPSGTRRIAAAWPRIPNAPWVLVQMVTWPSAAQRAVAVCGSM